MYRKTIALILTWAVWHRWASARRWISSFRRTRGGGCFQGVNFAFLGLMDRMADKVAKLQEGEAAEVVTPMVVMNVLN